jgi:hypothetical protein
MTSRDRFVSVCVTVTLAPGSAAPVSSVTLPTSVPYSDWAPTFAETDTSTATSTLLHPILMHPPKTDWL